MKTFSSIGIALLIGFATLARGAQDYWSATVVYVFILVLGVAVLFWSSWGGSARGVRVALAAPLFSLIFVFLLSFQRAINPHESFYELLDWFSATLLFYIGLQIFDSDETIPLFFVVLIPIFWVQLVLNVKNVLAEPLSVQFQRSAGSLVNANIAAGFLLFWVPPLIHKIKQIKHEKRFFSLYWISGLLVVFLNLIFARSTFAWFCLALGLPFIVGWDETKTYFQKKKKQFFSLFIFVLLGIGVLLFFKWKEFFGQTGGTLSSTTSRLVWWKAGWAMFLERPFFGVGLGNYGSAYLAYKETVGQNTLFAHNFLITLLAETGIAGLVSFLFLCFVFVRKGWQAALRDVERKSLFLGWCLFFVFASFNVSLEYLINLLVFFLFMSVALAKSRVVYWKPSRLMCVMSIPLTVSALPFILSPFFASQNHVHAERLFLKGRYDEAIKHFETATVLDSRSWMSFEQGARSYFHIYLSSKDKDHLRKAIDWQKRAIEQYPLQGRLHWALGVYFVEARQLKEAAEAFSRASDLHKTNPRYKMDYEKFKPYLTPPA